MAKSVKHSEMAKEIKKKYLVEHLDVVEKLIAEWIPQLQAPPPLSPREGKFGWGSLYMPRAENDPDDNHILRQHVRSRAFWRHHADWERQVNGIWPLVEGLRGKVSTEYTVAASGEPPDRRENFLGVALAVAFDSLHQNKQLRPHYEIPDDGAGVAWGAFMIDATAATEPERENVKHEHLNLVKSVAQLDAMKDLVESWREVERLQRHMMQLARKTLKSRDILHPCRFCRHLWK